MNVHEEFKLLYREILGGSGGYRYIDLLIHREFGWASVYRYCNSCTFFLIIYFWIRI